MKHAKKVQKNRELIALASIFLFGSFIPAGEVLACSGVRCVCTFQGKNLLNNVFKKDGNECNELCVRAFNQLKEENLEKSYEDSELTNYGGKLRCL